MTSYPTLQKQHITLNNSRMMVYYLDEQGIEFRGAKDAETGWELMLDEAEQDEAIRKIEETI